jgi:hypothetical protein
LVLQLRRARFGQVVILQVVDALEDAFAGQRGLGTARLGD